MPAMSWKLPFGFVGYLPLASTAIFVAVPKNYHVVVDQFLQKLRFFLFGEQESAFAMSNGHSQHLALWDFAGEYAFALVFVFEVNPFALEALRNVRRQRSLGINADAFKPGQQALFNKDLEAVADAQYRAVLVDECCAVLCRVWR